MEEMNHPIQTWCMLCKRNYFVYSQVERKRKFCHKCHQLITETKNKTQQVQKRDGVL